MRILQRELLLAALKWKRHENRGADLCTGKLPGARLIQRAVAVVSEQSAWVKLLVIVKHVQ